MVNKKEVGSKSNKTKGVNEALWTNLFLSDWKLMYTYEKKIYILWGQGYFKPFVAN